MERRIHQELWYKWSPELLRIPIWRSPPVGLHTELLPPSPFPGPEGSMCGTAHLACVPRKVAMA